MMGELLTISEAAKRIHVSRQTIYTWIQEGRIKPVLTPGGRRRIPEEQLIIGKLESEEQYVSDVFPVRNISQLDSIQNEPMGTKEKYWFPRTEEHWYWDSLGSEYREFIFKAGREGMGENWAEKVAAELCTLLDLPHAQYDLATYKNKRGVISPTFVPSGASLRHGNEILATYIVGYEKSKRYHQTQHTVNAVFDILNDEKVQLPLGWIDNKEMRRASDVFTGYLMLDALIANTDRHHENWGLIGVPQAKKVYLAPTFDHASSLGRNVTDDERWERLTTKDAGRSMSSYVNRARSAFYLDQDARKPLSTLEVFQQAACKRPEGARYWLNKLEMVSPDDIEAVILKIPSAEMSEVAKEFSWTILNLNKQRLLALKT